jgi:hypothetical protein
MCWSLEKKNDVWRVANVERRTKILSATLFLLWGRGRLKVLAQRKGSAVQLVCRTGSSLFGRQSGCLLVRAPIQRILPHGPSLARLLGSRSRVGSGVVRVSWDSQVGYRFLPSLVVWAIGMVLHDSCLGRFSEYYFWTHQSIMKSFPFYSLYLFIVHIRHTCGAIYTK